MVSSENGVQENVPYKVGLLIAATGKYIKFIPNLIQSAKKYFLPNQDVTYFLFTDGNLEETDNVVKIYQEKRGWPYDSMMRYEIYYNAKELFKDMDYIFACDADMLFEDYVGDEILGERVGSLHRSFIHKRGTYETRCSSLAYIAPYEGTHYFAGGFVGGTKEAFLKMAKKITENIYKDLEKNIIAVWHDESHLNRYFLDNTPTVILSPSYCFPEKEHWWKWHRRLVALHKPDIHQLRK